MKPSPGRRGLAEGRTNPLEDWGDRRADGLQGLGLYQCVVISSHFISSQVLNRTNFVERGQEASALVVWME